MPVSLYDFEYKIKVKRYSVSTCALKQPRESITRLFVFNKDSVVVFLLNKRRHAHANIQ